MCSATDKTAADDLRVLDLQAKGCLSSVFVCARRQQSVPVWPLDRAQQCDRMGHPPIAAAVHLRALPYADDRSRHRGVDELLTSDIERGPLHRAEMASELHVSWWQGQCVAGAVCCGGSVLRGQDLNLRPSGDEGAGHRPHRWAIEGGSSCSCGDSVDLLSALVRTRPQAWVRIALTNR